MTPSDTPSASTTHSLPPTTVAQPEAPATPRANSIWEKYLVPLLVILFAGAILVIITRNWNAWESRRTDQVTDDAYVRGDVTPLSTKVAGIVQDVKVSDYQQVRAGQLLVQLEDDDYRAQVAQAKAAVEAAKAAIENNRRQRELQDAKIARALAGVDEANAQIIAAQHAIEAVRADVVRTEKERKRQETLLETSSSTPQKVEQVVADQERTAAQMATRQADLDQAKAMLRSNQQSVEAERRTKAVMESQEMQLIAELHVKEAALDVANINLGYTRITAPTDGSVGERQVRPGQLVSPGTQVIPFLNNNKWVEANYKETQLTNVRVGDPAELRVDEYPGKVFRGKVIEIAPASGSQFALLPPDNAAGNFTKVVQRIPVKIVLDDAQVVSNLRPGLSVIVTIRTRLK